MPNTQRHLHKRAEISMHSTGTVMSQPGAGTDRGAMPTSTDLVHVHALQRHALVGVGGRLLAVGTVTQLAIMRLAPAAPPTGLSMHADATREACRNQAMESTR